MRWDAIIKRVPRNRKIIGVEVGVKYGENSRRLLEALPNLTLIMVDNWGRNLVQNKRKRLWYKKVKRTAERLPLLYPGRAIIIDAESVEAAKHFGYKIDFVFIDACHDYECVRDDIAAWAPLVKPGGWVTGHDYDIATAPPGSKYRECPGVRRAVDEAYPEGVETDDDCFWGVRV